VTEAEAELTRPRRGEAAENWLKAEAGCPRPRQNVETEARQSENHVNDDSRNFDNKLYSQRNTHPELT